MKKFLMTLLVAAGCLAVFASDEKKPAWMDTLGKVKDLSGDTGISGFMKKAAPAYITGEFDMADRPA